MVRYIIFTFLICFTFFEISIAENNSHSLRTYQHYIAKAGIVNEFNIMGLPKNEKFKQVVATLPKDLPDILSNFEGDVRAFLKGDNLIFRTKSEAKVLAKIKILSDEQKIKVFKRFEILDRNHVLKLQSKLKKTFFIGLVASLDSKTKPYEDLLYSVGKKEMSFVAAFTISFRKYGVANLDRNVSLLMKAAPPGSPKGYQDLLTSVQNFGHAFTIDQDKSEQIKKMHSSFEKTLAWIDVLSSRYPDKISEFLKMRKEFISIAKLTLDRLDRINSKLALNMKLNNRNARLNTTNEEIVDLINKFSDFVNKVNFFFIDGKYTLIEDSSSESTTLSPSPVATPSKTYEPAPDLQESPKESPSISLGNDSQDPVPTATDSIPSDQQVVTCIDNTTIRCPLCSGVDPIACTCGYLPICEKPRLLNSECDCVCPKCPEGKIPAGDDACTCLSLSPYPSEPPQLKDCCICQYHKIEECGSISSSNWENPESICEDCSYREKPDNFIDACNNILIGSTSDCSYNYDLKACVGRFENECLDQEKLHKNLDLCEGGFYVVTDDDFESDFDTSISEIKLTCNEITWFRSGHDQNCDITKGAIEVCMKCSEGNCYLVNTGCSVLQDYSELQVLIDTVKKQLKSGETVTLEVNQAVSVDKLCESKTIIEVKSDDVEISLPKCNELGFEAHLEQTCLSVGETVKCMNENGKEDWVKCCPTKKEYGYGVCEETKVFTNISWDGKPPAPLCPGVAAFHGTCSATYDKTDPDYISKAYDKVAECVQLKLDECYELEPLKWSSEYKNVVNDTVSNDYTCEYKTKSIMCD
jgi:hypothetical protein